MGEAIVWVLMFCFVAVVGITAASVLLVRYVRGGKS